MLRRLGAALLAGGLLTGCPLTVDDDYEISPASCRNEKQDNAETDVDCGGSECLRCAAGERCIRNDDCQTEHCDKGSCRPL